MASTRRVVRPRLLPRLARWVDDRLGTAKVVRKALDKIFPDHWSFMLGEVVLYCFVILIVTGVFLTFFFEASPDTTTYAGSYGPLRGVEMSHAYESAIRLSFDVRAGLVMRQAHHWAALIFLGSITAHLLRVFFTGAFRRPREVNWLVGVTMLLLALANGFLGYSLLDDQLSASGLRIVYGVVLAIPLAGTWIASLVFGGEFPGPSLLDRFYVLHILIVPAALAALIGVHLAILVRHKHAHFPGPGRRDDNVVGERLWPTYAAKAMALFFLTAAVVFLLAGVAQINPIWIYGPFRPADVSAASQPDWYLGFLDGALRIMPPWEIRAFGYEVPNPFFPGVLMPGVVFAVVYLAPFIEARFTGDRREHHVLDRPRDRPLRTALGVGVLTGYLVLLGAASSDIISVQFGLSVNLVIWIFRVAVVVLPLAAGVVAHRVCRELGRRDGPLPSPADLEPTRQPELVAGD
jgi:ubiquinol-cytochrome c reductase cytochrome b subunit